MQGLSQAIFFVLKGAAVGFGTLVLTGVSSYFAYVLFSRRAPKSAWLWASVVSLVFLAVILYFGSGRVLLGHAEGALGAGPLAPTESDQWFSLFANAIGGLLGIVGGIKLRTTYWPASAPTPSDD